MSRTGWIGFALLGLLMAFVIVSSMGWEAHSCEVCITYRGQQQCRTVGGSTVEEAREGAITNACAFLSGGVTDSLACGRQQPDSINCR